MAATIIVEDGTGLATANSYLSLADAEIYFATHPQSSAWDALTDDQKNRYLISGARVLDACFDFSGFKISADQALQWPRIRAADPDQSGEAFYRAAGTSITSGYFPEDEVPKGVKDAQCEMARMLVASNRMDDAPGTGIREFELPGSIRVAFETGRLQEIVPDFIINMMARFGSFRSRRSGNVKLMRA